MEPWPIEQRGWLRVNLTVGKIEEVKREDRVSFRKPHCRARRWVALASVSGRSGHHPELVAGDRTQTDPDRRRRERARAGQRGRRRACPGPCRRERLAETTGPR